MADQLLPQCGVCKKLYQRDQGPPYRVRLAAEDMEGKKYPEPKKPGLYQCCEDCHATYLPVVAARMGKAPEDMSFHCAM